MLPEIWQQVQRILLICAFNDTDLVLQLAPALQLLCQALPEAEIQFLILQEDHYDFLTCGSQARKQSARLFSISMSNQTQLIDRLKDFSFDAAIIFTTQSQSPYSFAYLCYLANIPIRLGQSLEFGGGLLTPWVKPLISPVSLADHHLHLLRSAGFITSSEPEAVLSFSSALTGSTRTV